MTSGIDRISWDINHASGYLLCFDVPFGPVDPGCHADHYDGIADVLRRRLSRHEQGKGAKLTAYARRAGIGWTLTRIGENIDRTEERRLKANCGMAWCPRCRTEKVMAKRDPAYGQAIAAAKAQYQATVGTARAAWEQAASRSAGTRLWNRAVATAHEELQAARHEAAQAWISAHPRSGLTRAGLACVLDATPVVTPPMRARRAVLDAQAAATARAWPDGFLPDGAERGTPDSLTDPDDPRSGPLPAPGNDEPRGLIPVATVPGDPWAWPETEAG